MLSRTRSSRGFGAGKNLQYTKQLSKRCRSLYTFYFLELIHMRKNRKQKEVEYDEKFGHIPIDYFQRLEWLYDELKITPSKANEILLKRDMMIQSLHYTDTNIILFEIPEGSPRPRFRLVNRQNLSNMALSNPNFVHVYSLTGYEDNVFMKRLMEDTEFAQLDQMICTPCVIDINAYVKTPSYLSKEDTILAEIGLQRPLTKPDWDNIEKKYSDMFNKNVWLDDTFVVDGAIHKYYSVLPRVEIRLRYLNMVYNKNQYNSIVKRVDFPGSVDLQYCK